MNAARTHDPLGRLVLGVGGGPLVAVERVAGGGNNRAVRVEAMHGRYFAKNYFRDGVDPRDRMGAETAFLRHCAAHSIAGVPRLLATDDDAALALFGWIDGRAASQTPVSGADVDAALAFFARLNAERVDPRALELPAASEASFSLAEHFSAVERRVATLEGAAEVDPELADFVSGQLRPLWSAIRARVEGDAVRGWSDPLSARQRCLSPSDFGFHNALRTADGSLLFHDFEYAGWDDPAKTVADFFFQPRSGVGGDEYGRFADRVIEILGLDPSERRRIDVLRPLMGLRWCCIHAGQRVADAARRRRYAGAERRAAEGLDRARALAASLRGM